MNTKTPKVASKEDVEDLKVAEQIRDMMYTDGWKMYSKILQAKIDEKTAQLLMPLHPIYAQGADGVPVVQMMDGVAHVLVGEAAKGAIMGLRLALTLPSGIVAGAEQIRRKLNPSDAEVGT